MAIEVDRSRQSRPEERGKYPYDSNRPPVRPKSLRPPVTAQKPPNSQAPDPPPMAPVPLQTPQSLPQTGRSATSAPPASPTTVSIQIHLPKLPLTRLKRLANGFIRQSKRLLAPLVRRRRSGLLAAVGAVVVAGAVTGALALHHRNAGSAGGSAKGASAGAAVAAKPTFTPVAPSAKPQLGKLGANSAFDGAHQVYSYIDSLDKQQITVSEQQTPTRYKSADDAATNIAKTFGPNTTLETKWGTSYIVTNTKYNSQTVVAPVKNLLLFIQASQIHSNDGWKTYLESLR